jgi:hypothetical protein
VALHRVLVANFINTSLGRHELVEDSQVVVRPFLRAGCRVPEAPVDQTYLDAPGLGWESEGWHVGLAGNQPRVVWLAIGAPERDRTQAVGVLEDLA